MIPKEALTSAWREKLWVACVGRAPLRAYGRLVQGAASIAVPQPLRAPLFGWLARNLSMDLTEAELDVNDYNSFQELFVRRLRADLRPIDGTPNHAVIPADGCLSALGEIKDGSLIQAKGISYTTSELLADETLANRFWGGRYAVVYLRPRDYHRVHAPCTGKFVEYRHIAGTLVPVKPAFVRHRRGLFTRNERMMVIIDAGDYGYVAVICVGATAVGAITSPYETALCGTPIVKGSELATFNLGSTVIVLFEGGVLDPLQLSSGQELRMGRQLGVLHPRAQA